ncbi:hypothetical protein QBC45DRAFT_417088, partial [Copromyces sp. CBS 386.78]
MPFHAVRHAPLLRLFFSHLLITTRLASQVRFRSSPLSLLPCKRIEPRVYPPFRVVGLLPEPNYIVREGRHRRLVQGQAFNQCAGKGLV